MRKYIALLTLGALMLTATTVFANEVNGEAKVRAEIKTRGLCMLMFPEKCLDWKLRGENKFVIEGTVNAVGTTSLTVDIRGGAHIKNVSDPAVVAVDADTKITRSGKTTISLAGIKVGDRVVVKGEIGENSALTADHVMVEAPKPVVFGTVTTKTDTSITVKNSVTGTEKVLTVNPDTKVSINGEAKTAADVQIGDKGVVKFKAVLDTFVATMMRLFR